MALNILTLQNVILGIGDGQMQLNIIVYYSTFTLKTRKECIYCQNAMVLSQDYATLAGHNISLINEAKQFFHS